MIMTLELYRILVIEIQNQKEKQLQAIRQRISELNDYYNL